MTASMAECLLNARLMTPKSKRVASVAAHLGRQFSVRALSAWLGDCVCERARPGPRIRNPRHRTGCRMRHPTNLNRSMG